MAIPLPTPVKNSAFREGVGIKNSDINKWIIAGGCDSLMLDGRLKKEPQTQNGKDFHIMSDVSDAYNNANELIKNAHDAMNKTIQNFRSTIKNDLASISSASDRVTGEVQKMNKNYAAAIETLTSERMQTAIENAERLANALTLISNVKSSDISLTLGSN